VLAREIAAVSAVSEGDNRRSHTPRSPDVMRLSQESDIRLVVVAVLRAGTVNVKDWLIFPDVANRITHPVSVLEVVNGTLPEVAPASILSAEAIVNPELVGFSLTFVGVRAGSPREIRQLPETPGVRTIGEQERDKGLGGVDSMREIVAVDFAAPRVAVMTASCAVVIVAADAVKVVEAALAGTVTVA